MPLSPPAAAPLTEHPQGPLRNVAGRRRILFSRRDGSPRSLAMAPVLLAAGLVSLIPLAASPAHAFDVFCVSNGDGTSTCEGWRGGETLTCVGSPGGVSTCSVPSGRRFTCTLSVGGATTCGDNATDRPDGDGTNCTFTGDGNFVCKPPPPRSQPLLPGPSLPSTQDRPDLPPLVPLITNPSVF